jgi:hypothetical protein
MATIGIRYVDKSAPGYGHEHITHLGSDTERFTRAEVIRRLEKREPDIFYVSVGKDVALIQVVDDRLRGKYVRTVADGKPTDNLLYLPACPSRLRQVA